MAKQTVRGFSLIELLVIVSIVAVLIALLMPSLKMARARSQDAVCASNLRQMTTGMSLYATANRDYFPPMEIVTAGLTTFPDRLDQAGVLNGATTVQKQSIFLCPEYDLSIYRSQYSGFKVTYGVNLWVVGYRQNPPHNWVVPGKRRSHLLNPAKVPLLGDGVYQMASGSNGNHVYLNFTYGFEIGKYHYPPARYDPAAWTRYAHRDSPQAGFVDGHVEQRPGPWTMSVIP